MRYNNLPCILILSFILSITAAPCSGDDAHHHTIPIMPADKLTAGMRGYGKTVFSGDRIDTFDVEILGVLKNWEAKGDMILIKMYGDTLEKTGIISGMSGSPVYIDGKIIGAVAYGWSFAKEPIAGVTPIEDMLNVMNLGTEAAYENIKEDSESYPGMWEMPEPPPSPQGPKVKEASSERVDPESRLLRLRPIRTPLVISGFDQRVLTGMSLDLQKHGLFPVQGGGYSQDYTENTGPAAELVPGSAVAAVLATGDINASAIGTVTYCDGKNILAFGHPFMQSGETDMPMAGAYVYTVLPSQSTSLKIASPTRVVGRISQDRKSALAGVIGEFARMIPCRIHVKGVRDVEYNFEVVDDRSLTQTIFQWAAESALLATERQAGDKTVRLSMSLYTDQMERPIKIENTLYEPHPTWFPISYITHPISTIMNNNFKSVRIEKIELEAEVSSDRNVARIQEIHVNKRHVKPGETVRLTVTIKPSCQEPVTWTIPIQVPPDTARGSYITLNVCNSNTSQAIERSRAPDVFRPSSFEHLVDLLESDEPTTNLIVRVLLPKRGVTFKGQRFPSLPSSLLSVMSLSNHSGIGRLMDEVVHREPVGWVLTGSKTLSLFVEED